MSVACLMAAYDTGCGDEPGRRLRLSWDGCCIIPVSLLCMLSMSLIVVSVNLDGSDLLLNLSVCLSDARAVHGLKSFRHVKASEPHACAQTLFYPQLWMAGPTSSLLFRISAHTDPIDRPFSKKPQLVPSPACRCLLFCGYSSIRSRSFRVYPRNSSMLVMAHATSSTLPPQSTTCPCPMSRPPKKHYCKCP